MMADKAEIDINGHKYSVKKADAASHPASDIIIDGIKYAINMTRILIQPSTDDHSPTIPTMSLHQGFLTKQEPLLIVVQMEVLLEQIFVLSKK